MKDCANCTAKLAVVHPDNEVGPYVYCSAVCRNAHVLQEFRRMRAAVIHALVCTRSKKANEILHAGLAGTYEMRTAT